MYFLQSDERMPWALNLQLLRFASIVLVSLSLTWLAASTYGLALFGRLAEASVTHENRHALFVRFIDGELRVPSRNRDAAFKSAMSLLLIDVPFLLIRIGASVLLRVGPSPLVVKNAFHIVWHLFMLARCLHWRCCVWQLRRSHRRRLQALDARIFDLATAGPGVARGEPMGPAVYHRIGEVYDGMGGPESEFMALYSVDLGGACDPPWMPGGDLSTAFTSKTDIEDVDAVSDGEFEDVMIVPDRAANLDE